MLVGGGGPNTRHARDLRVFSGLEVEVRQRIGVEEITRGRRKDEKLDAKRKRRVETGWH